VLASEAVKSMPYTKGVADRGRNAWPVSKDDKAGEKGGQTGVAISFPR
jgi:hypothetical protein